MLSRDGLESSKASKFDNDNVLKRFLWWFFRWFHLYTPRFSQAVFYNHPEDLYAESRVNLCVADETLTRDSKLP